MKNELNRYNYVVVFGETKEGRTIRYNDNHTVKVVKVDQPMYYTESGANKVVAIYESMKCTCVKAMKASEWEQEMGINY